MDADYLIELDGETLVPDELPAGLPPLSEAEAEAVIGRIVACQHRIAEIQANAAALVRREERRIESLLYVHGERLKEFILPRLPRNRRSYTCLSGVAGFRTVPARLRVEDEAVALAWAQAQTYPPVRVSVDLKRLGKPAAFRRIGEHGEEEYAPPPGFSVTPERTEFYVKSGARPAEGTGDE